MIIYSNEHISLYHAKGIRNLKKKVYFDSDSISISMVNPLPNATAGKPVRVLIYK